MLHNVGTRALCIAFYSVSQQPSPCTTMKALIYSVQHTALLVSTLNLTRNSEPYLQGFTTIWIDCPLDSELTECFAH